MDNVRKMLLEDLQTLKPTIFGSFPLFYNRIAKAINAKMEQQSGYARWMFNKGLTTKLEHLKDTGEVVHSMYDKLVFSKLRQLLGGRVRYLITGGAPIAQEVMDFIRVVFSCPMIQAYGITETNGFTCASSIWETRAGVVGGPLPCLKMKLKDIPALGYLTTDDPPRGEVLFKGNSVFKGYFRNKELTDKVFTEDGWLRTEDVAYLNEGGGLTIIDRLNSFCKLQSGRFVPPQSLENMYS